MTVHKQTPFSLSRNTSEEVGVTKGRSEFNHPVSQASLPQINAALEAEGEEKTQGILVIFHVNSRYEKEALPAVRAGSLRLETQMETPWL